MSKAKMPPVPPANRPPQGGSAQPAEAARDSKSSERDVNVEQQGQTANTRQNTTHQGRQQDR